VLTKLLEIGLTARGSGVDNVRNITASPTAGIDPAELMDTRPLAKALHYYILNHRDLYGLPRKFNVAFDGGGSVSVVAETNDIGFVAVGIKASASGRTLPQSGTDARSAGPDQRQAFGARPLAGALGQPALPGEIEPGVYFRAELAGITGHRQ